MARYARVKLDVEVEKDGEFEEYRIQDHEGVSKAVNSLMELSFFGSGQDFKRTVENRLDGDLVIYDEESLPGEREEPEGMANSYLEDEEYVVDFNLDAVHEYFQG